MDFNFEAGGVAFGGYFPALKNVNASIRRRKGDFFVYEPGNGTRYDVLFGVQDTGFGEEVVMSVVNMRKCMIISGQVGIQSMSYIQEKLELGAGDCYALIPLINFFIHERGA